MSLADRLRRISVARLQGIRRGIEKESLRALLAAGASHQLKDRQGNTPLQLARTRGYAEMVQMLEKAGAR